MTVVFDLYQPGSSPVHQLDPRTKFAIVLLGITAAFALPQLWMQVLLLCGVQLLLGLAADISWNNLWTLWKRLAPLVLFIMILQPWFKPEGPALLQIGPLTLTVAGILFAAGFVVRAACIAFIVAGLLLTTTHDALVLAAVKLGLPYTWGLTFSLMLRFLPAISSMFQTVMQAQSARGWVQSSKWNPIKRLQEYLPILVAVIVGTLRMSDQLTLALAARGLTRAPRTRWHDLHMRWVDWLWLGMSLVLWLLLLWWRFVIL